MNLNTNKPIAYFDIEATGINFRTDRIVELGIVKQMPDGTTESHNLLLNPERPIPAEAIAVHGITDEHVKDCPTFVQIADRIADIFGDCDLGGYNIIHYDIPMLISEFERAAVPFDIEGRRIIDVQKIFHKREPRDLTAALAFYCNDTHTGAHGAMSDVEATMRVLDGQFQRYEDLPKDIDALSAYCDQRDPSWVDRKGRFKWANGEVIINFGKKQGKLLREIAQMEPSYLKWMINGTFPPDTIAIAKDALNGKFPEAPTPSGSTGE